MIQHKWDGTTLDSKLIVGISTDVRFHPLKHPREEEEANESAMLRKLYQRITDRLRDIELDARLGNDVNSQLSKLRADLSSYEYIAEMLSSAGLVISPQ